MLNDPQIPKPNARDAIPDLDFCEWYALYAGKEIDLNDPVCKAAMDAWQFQSAYYTQIISRYL